jgi:hypothetical protein
LLIERDVINACGPGEVDEPDDELYDELADLDITPAFMAEVVAERLRPEGLLALDDERFLEVVSEDAKSKNWNFLKKFKFLT